MYNEKLISNDILDEKTYHYVLKDGLNVYICKKKGFKKKIGLFGTRYGSINNDFVDITTNERIKVPDGIAHFLEHKLFEKEGANALDLFSKMGVSSNAYTSFDHTVYFFETMNKFEECIKMLVKLVKEPYFTDENVAKEQGIIGQEIMMYDDDPGFVVYFNALRAMYSKHPIRIDIAGTIESISHITKDLLYTCYNTFYSPQNMFFIVVGDVDEKETLKMIEENIKLYEKNYDLNSTSNDKIQKFYEDEPTEINKKRIEKEMDIYMPQICIGYKLKISDSITNIKNAIIADIVSDMYFSKLSDFYDTEYNNGIISFPVEISFEGSNNFSHIVIIGASTNIEKLETDLNNYIKKIKDQEIDKDMFELAKKRKIGSLILSSDRIDSCYRRIIESDLENVKLYSDIEILNKLTIDDVKEFLNLFNEDSKVVSIVKEKNK